MKKYAWTLAVVLGLIAVCGCAAHKECCGTGPATAAPAAKAAPGELVLLPVPRSLNVKGGRAALWNRQRVSITGVSEASVGSWTDHLRGILDQVGCTPGADAGTPYAVELKRDAQAMPHPQGYLLSISKDGIDVVGADEPGLFYAMATLTQIARQSAGTGSLPCLHIEDWPDFPNRGIMLDVARDKVPEMASLYALVNQMAEWKFNQLQLYTEHTFAYRNHHTVWDDASPMTATQIRALDAYCKERHIELVPNQNSFGHMGRWLQHPEYKHLGEMPDGGSEDLCPVDPGSIALLEDMYTDMLPNFSSKQVNVGCDETWSLGKGRSKEACEKEGVGRVYLGFITKIHDLVAAQGRTMQFWGDIIMQHPELIPQVPKGVIAMEWGYEAKHPFLQHGKKFAESGIPFYVVPGTSTWNSLAGRTDNAVANLRNAAENGAANGAIGYLVTDWGDGGHWQFLPASYLGFAYGAAMSWASASNKDISITHALDVLVFQDAAGVMGKLAFDLGNAYQKCGVMPGNNSIFYLLLSHSIENKLPGELTPKGLQDTIAYIDNVMASLPNAKMAVPDAELIRHEFDFTARLMRFACKLGTARLEAGNVPTSQAPADKRHALAAEFAPMIPEFRQLWLARNRSGGLKDSAGRFEALLAILAK